VAGAAAPTKAPPPPTFEERVEALFREPLAERMALSPDGHRVAYTTQEGGNLKIVIMNVEQPSRHFVVTVAEARGVAFSAEKAPAQLRFMRWATTERLVFAPTEQVFPLPSISPPPFGSNSTNGFMSMEPLFRPNPSGPQIIAPILAVDADAQNGRELIDAEEFTTYPPSMGGSVAAVPVWKMPHLDILGINPDNREQVIIETRGGGQPRQRLAVNIRTGKHAPYGGAWNGPRPTDTTSVFDAYQSRTVGFRVNGPRPSTRWKDPDLEGLQRDLERKFSHRTVEITEWSEDRNRVLFRVTGGGDPGRAFVYQRPENIPVEIFRRAPWLGNVSLHDTRFFEFDSADGAYLSGYVTWPGRPKLNPPPLLVCFPPGFPNRPQPAFDAEAQVMAELGFVVLRLNHRHVMRLPSWDSPEMKSLVESQDRVAVSDARDVINWLAEGEPTRPFDRKRIAAFGYGYGGYLAVRALELQPDVFRCGVALDAPMDLRWWIHPSAQMSQEMRSSLSRDIPRTLWDMDSPRWKDFSAVTAASQIQGAVYFIVEPVRNEVVDQTTAQLRSALKSLRRPAELLDLDPAFRSRAPKARAAVYRKIDEFFNLNLYRYDVKVGPTKEVK
jgi:hypothetical protein